MRSPQEKVTTASGTRVKRQPPSPSAESLCLIVSPVRDCQRDPTKSRSRARSDGHRGGYLCLKCHLRLSVFAHQKGERWGAARGRDQDGDGCSQPRGTQRATEPGRRAWGESLVRREGREGQARASVTRALGGRGLGSRASRRPRTRVAGAAAQGPGWYRRRRRPTHH